MIYPQNFEQKIGFDIVRRQLSGNCLSSLGKEMVEQMAFTSKPEMIETLLKRVTEFRFLQQNDEQEFPLMYFFDVRPSVKRIRLKNTYMTEQEFFDLLRSLQTIEAIKQYLSKCGADEKLLYPTLHALTQDIQSFPALIQQIGNTLDRHGHVKDNASKVLSELRCELKRMEGSVSRIMQQVIRTAQQDGIVDKDVAPTLRDGRLVIPVQPGMKRKIDGIVHDESASGRTLFIEPTAVVEANNKIRELESEERQEVIRILTALTDEVRPHFDGIIQSYQLLADIDFIQAKARLAKTMSAIEPLLQAKPMIDWIDAVHPLLAQSLSRQDKKVVPLTITLSNEQRILLISGPNAGGKSVCLKTVGLLQYMLQCGMSIPLSEHSTTGVFQHLMIDIGDEQSIENDLSTYSSHLLNMKQMMRHANNRTLLLIDEFGSGTEPQIGGAIAEAVLKQFCKKRAYGVITTHYQNLKHFADAQRGVANAAMLYDRNQMQALFQLSIGQPGSSFAIEIARKTGLPEEVITDASNIVGSDYIQSDKYLQDIVRDKRYWENKRQAIHQHERDMQRTIERYESNVAEVDQQRRIILQQAKQQAEELLQEANRKIENTIREIREQQAEREETRRIREDLEHFKEEVANVDTQDDNTLISKKVAQIQARKERKEKRKKAKGTPSIDKMGSNATQSTPNRPSIDAQTENKIAPGDSVRIKGLASVGIVEQIEKNIATVILGEMHTKLPLERLEKTAAKKTATPSKMEQRRQDAIRVDRITRETIDNRRHNFHPDIDLRGMRADDALTAVKYYIDDAVLVGEPHVRILHGKGNGILRQLIREYLATRPEVKHFQDEHVQFGGAGITVVDLD